MKTLCQYAADLCSAHFVPFVTISVKYYPQLAGEFSTPSIIYPAQTHALVKTAGRVHIRRYTEKKCGDVTYFVDNIPHTLKNNGVVFEKSLFFNLV